MMIRFWPRSARVAVKMDTFLQLCLIIQDPSVVVDVLERLSCGLRGNIP